MSRGWAKSTADVLTATTPLVESAALIAETTDRRRWCALYVECFGVLMIVLDGTIVNVALSAIKLSLGFPDHLLMWVLNGYTICSAGFLLLSGPLGDRYGYRKTFLMGIGLFTCASFGCGVAWSPGVLVVCRGLQGLGAAVVIPVSLALILSQFTHVSERARALAVFSFACAGGGCAGLLLGGVLAGSLGWRWIFLVNIPVGALVWILCWLLLPHEAVKARGGRLDVAGAVSVTASLMFGAYAAAKGPEAGWFSSGALAAIGASIALFGVFVITELRAPKPLLAFRLLKACSFCGALAAGGLWTAALAGWYYLSALYLQRVLVYDPLRVGLAFLPVDLTMGIFALGLSARLVAFWGLRASFCAGALSCGLGMLLFAGAPVHARFLIDVCPGMLLIGLGAGVAYSPLLLGIAMSLNQRDYGAASGIFNSLCAMAGALSTALLGSVSATRTSRLADAGTGLPLSLTSGYHLGFGMGALLTVLAALLGALLLRPAAAGSPTRELSPQPPQ